MEGEGGGSGLLGKTGECCGRGWDGCAGGVGGVGTGGAVEENKEPLRGLTSFLCGFISK